MFLQAWSRRRDDSCNQQVEWLGKAVVGLYVHARCLIPPAQTATWLQMQCFSLAIMLKQVRPGWGDCCSSTKNKISPFLQVKKTAPVITPRGHQPCNHVKRSPLLSTAYWDGKTVWCWSTPGPTWDGYLREQAGGSLSQGIRNPRDVWTCIGIAACGIKSFSASPVAS